jgi:hypothetical protein
VGVCDGSFVGIVQEGQPKTFQEICKSIVIDSFLSSADDQLLYFYFFGILPPAKLVAENCWSEPPFPESQKELLAKYSKTKTCSPATLASCPESCEKLSIP